MDPNYIEVDTIIQHMDTDENLIIRSIAYHHAKCINLTTKRHKELSFKTILEDYNKWN